MLIDSHAHLDSLRYTDDREALLRRAWTAGVNAILSIGIGENAGGMSCAYDLARQWNQHPDSGRSLPHIYASAGVYPHNTPEIDQTVLAQLDHLLAQPEVIACGEIGLDYYHEGAPHAVQQQMFLAQIEVAARHRRPLLIHCRPKDGQVDAWEDLLAMLEEHWRPTGLGGILHCFAGTADQARRGIEMGFLCSFAGNLTYPKAQPLRDAALAIPLEHLLVETDAPYLAPVPYRGQRNEPAWVAETARLLAELKGVPVNDLALATTKNFCRLFGLQAIG